MGCGDVTIGRRNRTIYGMESELVLQESGSTRWTIQASREVNIEVPPVQAPPGFVRALELDADTSVQGLSDLVLQVHGEFNAGHPK